MRTMVPGSEWRIPVMGIDGRIATIRVRIDPCALYKPLKARVLDPGTLPLDEGVEHLALVPDPGASPGAMAAAARVQTSARAAAGEKLGAQSHVARVYGWFADERMAGLVQEWIEGRPWRLETDDRLFTRQRPGRRVEYRDPAHFRNEIEAKRFFLARIERLLIEEGASALARRFAGRGWLSPLRVIHRGVPGDDPYAGLVAVDFTGEWRKDLPQTPSPGAVERIGKIDASRPAARRRARQAGAWRILTRQDERERRLVEMVEEGLREGMLTDTEADRLREQAGDSRLQLYLMCMAAHLLMFPATFLIVSVATLIYARLHNLSAGESAAIVGGALAFFAVFPLSPGSLSRGLFTLGVVVWKRRLRGFRVALLCSFFRYVGYSAFPLQMVATFPALARYLAAEAATAAVRRVPRLGARGGRLEYAMFDLFFNAPLSIGRWWRGRQRLT